MTRDFGPWSSSISVGSRLELSTFWKHRLTALGVLRARPLRVSRVTACTLWLAAFAVWALPTLHAVVAPDDDQAMAEETQSLHARLASDKEAKAAKVLDLPIDVAFAELPLSAALRNIRERCKVTIRLDDDLQGVPFDGDDQVTLELHGVALRSCLELMLEPMQLGYFFDESTIVVTTGAKAGRHVNGWIFDVGDLAKAGIASEALARVIVATVEPKSWDAAGGEGTIRSLAGELRIRQKREIIPQVERLLALIRWQHTGAPDLPAGDRTTIYDPIRHELALRETLSESGAIDVTDQKFNEVAMLFARQWGVNILIDSAALTEAEINREFDISLHLKQTSLDAAFDALLHPHGLDWIAADGVIKITTPRKVRALPVTEVYGVADLVKKGTKEQEIVAWITRSADPEAWATAGGPATIHALPGLILIRHHRHGHAAVREALEELR